MKTIAFLYAVTDRKRNLGKSASPSKYLSPINEDLKSILNTLVTKIKKALASKNQTIYWQISQPSQRIIFSGGKSIHTERIKVAKEQDSKP